MLASIAGAALSSCGGGATGLFCLDCMDADSKFYVLTAIVLAPSGASIRAGNTVTSDVTLVYPGEFDDGAADFGKHTFLFDNLSIVTPVVAGVAPTLTPVSSAPCTAAELPLGFGGQRTDFVCKRYLLSVQADADSLSPRGVVLSAQWTSTLYRRVIERIETYTVFPADSAGFQLAVGAAAGGSYAVRTTVPVSIEQTGTGTVPVTLTFDPRGAFGLTGSFSPNPTTSAADLMLNIPARYAEGGLLSLQIQGRGAGIDVTKTFTLRIEPMFSMTLTPGSGTVSSSAPLDVRVDMTFSDTGRFAAAPPALTLSHDLLPEGTHSQWIPDATPTAFTSGRTITRTLRITSDGEAALTGPLAITATAPGLEADLAGERPFITRSLDLTFLGAPQWEYIENGASYTLTENDVVGIAMQSTNLPAIAWIEGIPTRAAQPATPTTPATSVRPGNRKVYVKRFDGTTFLPSPSPGPANALVAPFGEVGEARFALGRDDVAKVAFTFGDNDGLGFASAGTSWTVDRVFVPGPPLRVRSPRIAIGAAAGGDAVSMSYVVQTDLPVPSSELFVTRSIGASGFAVLAGSRAGGALNRDPAGRVLAGTPALAARPDGNPVVAWIEQPDDLRQLPVLWLRSFDGAAWGPAIAVPVTRPLVTAPLQLVVERAGTVVVAWLEDSPAAQLKVARCDLASANCVAQGNTGNDAGSLNAVSTDTARDFGLAIDSQQRVVVTWTEGGVRPQMRVKRQNADMTWSQVGPVIDLETTRTPRIVSDSNGVLYLNYTRFYFGADLLDATPITDIFVVRWPLR